LGLKWRNLKFHITKNEILTICVNVGKNIKNTDIYIDNLMQKRYICVKVGKKRIITEVYTNADDI